MDITELAAGADDAELAAGAKDTEHQGEAVVEQTVRNTAEDLESYNLLQLALCLLQTQIQCKNISLSNCSIKRVNRMRNQKNNAELSNFFTMIHSSRTLRATLLLPAIMTALLRL